MNSKKIISMLIAMVMVITCAFAFSACGKSNEGSSNKDEQTETSTTLSKEDQALKEKAEKMNKEEDNFYGRWVATTDYAEYLYGNLEITINEDGTFTGNVTEEDFSGTWEKTEKGIKFTSDILSGELTFGDKCKMVIYDEYDTNVTLEKQ